MALYLKNKKKIETIFEKGFIIKADGLLFKGYNFKDDEIKYGVSVSKKLFPLAVDRNLIKRRLKEQAKKKKHTAIVKFNLLIIGEKFLNRNQYNCHL